MTKDEAMAAAKEYLDKQCLSLRARVTGLENQYDTMPKWAWDEIDRLNHEMLHIARISEAL